MLHYLYFSSLANDEINKWTNNERIRKYLQIHIHSRYLLIACVHLKFNLNAAACLTWYERMKRPAKPGQIKYIHFLQCICIHNYTYANECLRIFAFAIRNNDKINVCCRQYYKSIHLMLHIMCTTNIMSKNVCKWICFYICFDPCKVQSYGWRMKIVFLLAQRLQVCISYQCILVCAALKHSNLRNFNLYDFMYASNWNIIAVEQK